MKKTILILAVLSVNLFGADLSLKKYFNDRTCDQVLNNGGLFKTCYDYKNKGPKYVAYTLKGDKVNVKNIKKRPRFYEDKNIPKKYRSSYSDYTHNIYKNDRGHIYEDAAVDYSQKTLNAVYVMSNIIPQHNSINRSIHAWKGLEKYGRTLATKLGEINVLNGVIYGDSPKKMGRNKISVPSAFWKMYYTKDFERCFYFKNKQINKAYKIKDYEVKCSALKRH